MALPQSLHAEQTRAPGTRLASLGLYRGAKFRVSTQLTSARLRPLPGLHIGPAASWHLLHVNGAFFGSYLEASHELVFPRGQGAHGASGRLLEDLRAAPGRGEGWPFLS